jgi:general secretion pathway protein L
LSGAGGDIVAGVPARALSWHQVELATSLLTGPILGGVNRTHLRAALESLLEDSLLDDPSSLHFALAPGATAGTSIWVAVCDRDWLRTAIQFLEQSGHPVTRIVPEFAPMSHRDEAAPTIYVTAGLEPAQLVVPAKQGVSLFPLSESSIGILNINENTNIVAEPGVAALAEHAFKRPVNLQTAAERWLQAAGSEWNLAQFDLIRSGRTRVIRRLSQSWSSLRHAPQWRVARWLTGLLLATQIIGLAWKERSLMEIKADSIRNTLLESFPEVRVVLDAPLQMEREVNNLRQSRGMISRNQLEAMLSALSVDLPDTYLLSDIDFSSGELRLGGLKLKPEELSELQVRLRARAYSVRSEGNDLVIRAETVL